MTQPSPPGPSEPPASAAYGEAMDALQYATHIRHRLRVALTLPEVLAAGFDGFEAIRLLARGNETRHPGWFAAFMTAADAAVDGREVLTLSPSLPPAGRPPPADGHPRDRCNRCGHRRCHGQPGRRTGRSPAPGRGGRRNSRGPG